MTLLKIKLNKKNKEFRLYKHNRISDSCEYQLLSIVHNIYSSFDQNPPLDMHSCFLGILKTFDKVWHEGPIYKTKTIGFTGNILRLLQSFLSNRYQRVTING